MVRVDKVLEISSMTYRRYAPTLMSVFSHDMVWSRTLYK